MQKNVASQVIGVQMVNAADGTAFTGTATVVVTIDGGTQSASGGTGPTHEGNGFHTYLPTQAETNGTHIGFTFTGSGAVPVTVQGYTHVSTDIATLQSTVDATSGAVGGSINVEATEDNTGGAIIDSVVFVGSVAGGTFASTEALDGTSHSIDDTTNVIDVVYGFSVGGGRVATGVTIHADVSDNTDEMLVKVYDHVGSDWETIGTLDGNAGMQALDIALLIKHTGLAAELGKVYIRLDTDSTTPSNILVDQILVSAVSIGQSVGYANGQIWVDTLAGTAGTEAYVNGTADNPVLTWADALTISAAVGITDFHIGNGSAITLTADSANLSLLGDNWDLALGGQNITGCHFRGASASGVGTATALFEFHECKLGAVTLDNAGLYQNCAFTATFTCGQAGVYTFHSGFTESSGADSIDANSVAVTLHLFDFHGEIDFTNLAAGDTVHITGGGAITTTTCTGGTIDHDGFFEYADAGGNVTEQQSDIKVGVDAIESVISTTHAELSAPPAATASLADKVEWIFMKLVNEGTFTLASGADTVANAAGTVIGTATGSDAAGVTTRGKYS
jgi:hypothetical protein